MTEEQRARELASRLHPDEIFQEARTRMMNDMTNPIDIDEHLVRVAGEHAAMLAFATESEQPSTGALEDLVFELDEIVTDAINAVLGGKSPTRSIRRARDAILALLPPSPVTEGAGGQDRKFAFRDGQFVNRVSG